MRWFRGSGDGFGSAVRRLARVTGRTVFLVWGAVLFFDGHLVEQRFPLPERHISTLSPFACVECNREHRLWTLTLEVVVSAGSGRLNVTTG